MAISIMLACCRASLLFLFLLGCFLQVLTQGEVFRAPRTQDVFLRSKRANMFLIEEILPGNLERECHEELCNYEEAREYFEDDAKTIAFWTVYYDGNQCEPNPCLNGGNCTDKVGAFQCSCTTPHYGTICELEALEELEEGGQPPSAPQITIPAYSECPSEGPTACDQLCTLTRRSFTCSCLAGFKLQADGHTCLPEVEFPCGRIPDKFFTTAAMCRRGKCPWQVSLLNSGGVELCGGVLLGRSSVLTAARCLFPDSESDLLPSNFFVIADDERKPVPVKALYIHNRFRTDHHDNDLALLQLAWPLPFSPTLIHLCLPSKDFCENILMHSGNTGIAGGRGVAQTHELAYMTLDDCRRQLNVSHPLSNKMFCMRSHNGAAGAPSAPSRYQDGVQERARGPTGNQNQTRHGPTGAENVTSSKTLSHEPSAASSSQRSEVSRRRCCGLLPGTPIATLDRGTVFLTGLLMSSSTGCDSLVFTKLSRYVSWIKPRLENIEVNMTPQVLQYPEIH